ncbi:GGDEF domain-containing protein [Ponticaulis sp.]|uniref:GGDEF domain-containing protein n=1 Tax=Ponticaulis sp. TaxID=2020902 RepID=UPI000B63E42D|nr:GGDEF domain-containing protein [Ponticaulis sp.]MAI91349.1 GGDEF domain-containing protein [Ponticaulis sp.]OUX97947.1 MAG: hypothetical protein CBB65_12975 [Hyphomonadaceae bacterium TMED5]|tara:strand:- start:27118 stop:27855 length:738 start_codon:yes stop_codon:yes gene_type:complete
MSEPTTGQDNQTGGKVLKLRPSAGDTSPVISAAASALKRFLAASGWTADDLTPNQLNLLRALMIERQHLVKSVETLKTSLDQAKSIADRDPLLPVYNRRAFTRELAKQISICERYNHSLCLLFLDLDHFKRLNDTLGHSVGDDALKAFIGIIQKHTRQSDVIGRLGGDEFAVLLLNADQEDGEFKAVQFAADLREIEFGNAVNPLYLDVSAGVVMWEKEESPEHLIERADEAMYLNKRRKNKARA